METDTFDKHHLGVTPWVHKSAEVVDCRLGAYTRVDEECVLLETEVGDYSYLCRGCDVAYATLGRFVSVASHVRIGPTNHPMWRASQHHFTYRSSSYGFGPDDDSIFEWRRKHHIEVGPDTWLGHGTTLMPGVRVGTGCVVGTGAVVTHDVPDYTIVAGVPARPLRDRFPDAVKERLLALAWWDWEHERIGAALKDFRELEIEAFLDKHESAGPTGEHLA